MLKAVREKTQTHQNKSRFFNGSLKNKKGMELFQALKENNFKPRIFYPTKLSLTIKGEIKTFCDKYELK
jgi:hypothetical protein